MTTFTEDQIKKIRETLGEEAVTKLTLPKVRVPKYVSGQWLVDYAHDGVEAIDFDGDYVIYRNGEGWSGSGYYPKEDIHQVFTIEEWPNGVIYDNCPPPERAEITENAEASDGGELKVGDVTESVEQLDSLPVGSVVARDANFPWTKDGNGHWVHVYDEGEYSSEVLYPMMSKCSLTVLRVWWES